jgi:hypothetical protein
MRSRRLCLRSRRVSGRVSSARSGVGADIVMESMTLGGFGDHFGYADSHFNSARSDTRNYAPRLNQRRTAKIAQRQR